MLDEESVPKFSTPGIEVKSYRFDQINRQITVVYQTAADIRSPVQLIISGFHNPVNSRPKDGFSIRTMDSGGFLINQSQDNLPLAAQLTQIPESNGNEMSMLGDGNGNEVGRIGTYQQISVYLSSQFPFEYQCYWTFEFPPTLQLDSMMSNVFGDGLFKPDVGTTLANSDFKVDLKKNMVIVTACKNSDQLTAKPFGQVTFSVVKLPDYLIPITPLKIRAYADFQLTTLIFEETKNEGEAYNQLQPGILHLDSFVPSDDFAFSKDVSYTIFFTPTHSSTKDTRITINMPSTLTFDPLKGCSTEGLTTVCSLEGNKITLTAAFTKDFPGKQQLKIVIKSATNPYGSREAGPWSILTENMFNGVYYKVDEGTASTSFFAKPGIIKSTIAANQTMTYSVGNIDLTFTPEHAIPDGGFLTVTIPKQTAFIGDISNPSAFFISKILKIVKMTETTMNFTLPEGVKGQSPISLSLLNVRTPRSFKTSSVFQVQSMGPDGYVIDAGGQDITLTMTQMMPLSSLSIKSTSNVNGAEVPYVFQFVSAAKLLDEDVVHIQLPQGLAVPKQGVSCKPRKGLKAIKCSSVATQVIVTLTSLEYDIGLFEFEVFIRNPTSFKASQPFPPIFLDKDSFNITISDPSTLIFIQTTEVATITQYNVNQQTKETGAVGYLEIQLELVNPLSSKGTLVMTWTDQVTVLPDTTCNVGVTKLFGKEACQFDINARTLTVTDVFDDSPKVSLNLGSWQNAQLNKDWAHVSIKTYEDGVQYPADVLEFDLKLRCVFPCNDCGSSQTQCTSCWETQGLPYLMQPQSTCQASCDRGWTTNGNRLKHCQKCDLSCDMCADSGKEGDKSICLSCGTGFDFIIPTDYSCIGPGCTGQCLVECPSHMYDSGNGICKTCDETCRTCSGTADTCTQCLLDSSLSMLLGSKCVEACPEGYGSNAGVCHQCDSKCENCGLLPDYCLSCRPGTYLLGSDCLATCPPGYSEDKELNKCGGCAEGCAKCDGSDSTVCLACESPLKLAEGACLQSCPPGFIANFESTECTLVNKNVTVVYFPWLIMTLIVFGISLAGAKSKLKHLLVPNWLVMMGIIENLSMATQIVMTFKFGTWRYIFPLIAAYGLYLLANPVFSVVFRFKIGMKDPAFVRWQSQPENRTTKAVLYFGGTLISWKFYKLLYSHFWGYNIKSAFKKPQVFRAMQRHFFLFNCFTTYPIMVVLNVVGLLDMDWGNQLYICFLENLVIVALMITVGLWEQRKQVTTYLTDTQFAYGNNARVMAAELDGQLDASKSKEVMLKRLKKNMLLVESKFEDLIVRFKGRDCASCCDPYRENEPDPRLTQTWPMHDSYDGEVKDPPEPLEDFLPDNVYAEGMTAEQIQMMKFLGRNMRNKNLQAEGYSADFTIRKDAEMILNERRLVMVDEPETATERKKHRGRKNRFFKQIDNEDNDAGVLLDSDNDSFRLKQAKQEEYLRQQQLEAIREEDRLEAERQEQLKRRKLQKMRALKLTEDNLRLKEQLERQREETAKEELEFQQQLSEENNRLSKLKEKINEATRLAEQKKATLEAMMEQNSGTTLAAVASGKINQGSALVLQSLGSESDKIADIQIRGVQSEVGDPKSPLADVPDYASVQKRKLQEDGASTANDNLTRAARLSLQQTADEASQNEAAFESHVELRTFNEIDIIGDLDRDERGNVLLFLDEATGKSVLIDAQYRAVNIYGYLVDKATGNIIDNDSRKVFDRHDLDERGNLPMPYALEKFNFNPFDIQGDFTFEDPTDPLSFSQQTSNDAYYDSKARLINAQGFLVDENGSILDRKGKIRFDWRQFAPYGGLIPRLYTYSGKTFEIHEVMGVFDRNGPLEFCRGRDKAGNEVTVDRAGYMVNSKGYIVNSEGSICNRQGKVLFYVSHLKNGEFPKIFPFTRFNIARVLGDFDLLENGQPDLTQQDGRFLDKQGKLVNRRGYLIDGHGNVIDTRKKVCFEAASLDENGDIPSIYQNNLLRSDSQSSLSRLMSEIDREQKLYENKKGRNMGSETSFESMMEESPSKYDQQNQRLVNASADGRLNIKPKWVGRPEGILEESDGDNEVDDADRPKKRRKKRTTQLIQKYVVDGITDRDLMLAQAYGGEAKPRAKKPGSRFATAIRGIMLDRSAVMTAQQHSRERTRAKMLQTGKEILFSGTTNSERKAIGTASGAARVATATNTGPITYSRASRQRDIPVSNNWQDSMIRTEDEASLEREKRSTSKENKKNNSKLQNGRAKPPFQHDRAFEEEFEKLYKKDIDKFIDGSDFDDESLAGFSDLSKGTFKTVFKDPKMRDLEKVYLQRLEFHQLNSANNAGRARTKKSKRPMMDRFNDDPREIMRGERTRLQNKNLLNANTNNARSQSPSGRLSATGKRQANQTAELDN